MNLSEYRAKVIPVANAEWKQAALYFDQVMPVQKKIFPREVSYKSTELISAAGDIYLKSYRKIFLDEQGKEIPQNQNEHTKKEKELLRYLDQHSVWPIVNLLRAQGIPSIPLFAYRESYDILGEGENEAIEVKTIDAELVEAEALEWDQIIEFRKDKSSVNDLRNFRLFLFENYSGKSPDYIRDSIEQKIEKHEQASKKHGFKLAKTVTSELVDSKSAIGCLCLATASHLLGDPITATTLGIAGASIAIGKLTISLASEYISYKADTANPEIAYVTKARKLFK